MRAQTTWLSDGEVNLITEQAVELLSTVGMRMKGSRVLPLLAERGARVEETTGVVHLPRELVQWALSQCPRTFTMAGATPAEDVVLGEGRGPHFCPSGCVAKTLDFRTGERRPSTLEDVRLVTGLLDELAELDLMWTQVSATDIADERRELAEYFVTISETSKHVTFVDCPSKVEPVVRLFEVLSGDLERFRERPRISTVVTAASPLQVEGPVLDTHVALAARGAPVEVYTMSIAGATSPVTLAGTVTQGVAEFLGIATALQVAAPGSRVVFCFGSGVLDMLQTTFSLGAVESALMAAAATEVGHHLGVPVLCPGLSTDAKYAGIQAGYEKALKTLAVCSAGPDIVTGWGLIDSHNTMSLPQSVIDNEIAAMVRRLLGNVEISEATVAAATVEKVGPGGDFLAQKETARRIRSGEHYMPTIATRLSYEKWVEEGASEIKTASALVEKLLAKHAAKEPYLADDQLREMASICHVGDDLLARARRL